MVRKISLALLTAFFLFSGMARSMAAEMQWQRLSSKNGELPVPGPSTQQTGALVADLDKDGVNDFVISFRKVGPALVWFRRTANGWDRSIIEKDFLTVEAGGAAHDIDNDGDQDVVFGGDWQSSEVWWWENPCPQFDANASWKRHLIKQGGRKQHHDQVFGDFRGTGTSQLAFWNQQAKTMFLAEIPPNPRQAAIWSFAPIFTGSAGEAGDKGAFLYAEGASAADIDADGKVDLLAGNYWFKHLGGTNFTPVKVGPVGGLIFAGMFKPGKYPQIVISPGDGVGPLRWYECIGQPTNSTDWVGQDLAGRDLVHGHSLQLGDIDQDGHLDIFAAEMAKWTESRATPDHPTATAWIFFGDGQGHFRKTVLIEGHGWHEARLADLDGDGDLDLLNKPYTWETPRIDVWLNNGTGSPAVAQIQHQLREVFDAAEKKDFARLDSFHLYGPKFTKFGSEAAGRQDAITAREGEHRGLAAVEGLFMRAQGLKVDVFGEAGIATFTLEYGVTTGANRVGKEARATLVFVKSGSDWKIAHEHISPVPGDR